MFGTFGGKVLRLAALPAALLTLLVLSWGALATGAGALLLTAGPAVLIAVLAWILVQVAAARLLSTWANLPGWWAWIPVGCAGAGVATWWRLTGQTVGGLRTAWLEAHRASVAFAAGLVVDGHPAPLELERYVHGTLPLALLLGTLAVASLDAWGRLDDHLERRRLRAEQRAAAIARQQEMQRQLEEARNRLRWADEQRKAAALRLEQHRQRQRDAESALLEELQRPRAAALASHAAPLGSPFPSTPRVSPRAAPDPADLV
jgi:hypothetical protein